MDEPIVKQSENNQPKYGFAAHPENINRNGRPKKGTTLTDLMRARFDEDPDTPRNIVLKLLEMAKRGDIAAIREVLDRVEGKPIQPSAEISESKMEDLLHIYKPERNTDGAK